MSWNYRILAHEDGEDMYFQIHEVHYTDDIPHSYSTYGAPIGGESIDAIKLMLNKMIACIEEPILLAGDKFPEVYER